MNWIFDNIQIVLAVAGALAYWLNQRRETKNRPGQAGESGSGEQVDSPTNGSDQPTIRQLQDEIRRKIMERRGSGPPPLPGERALEKGPLRVPETLSPRSAAGEIKRELRELWSAKLDEARAREERAARERARRMAEQAEALASEERESQRRLSAHARPIDSSPAPVGLSAPERGAPNSILSELRGPSNLRRAVVLREILGPPIALRPPSLTEG